MKEKHLNALFNIVIAHNTLYISSFRLQNHMDRGLFAHRYSQGELVRLNEGLHA
jgi:hypothetical protein